MNVEVAGSTVRVQSANFKSVGRRLLSSFHFGNARPLGALILSVTLGCKPPGTTVEVTHISVQALHDSLSANPSLLLVDVRTPAEWDSVRVQGVKKFIEHDQIGNRVAELNADTSASVYLICRRGHRSTLAAETLAKLGYKRLFSVDGGTSAWIAAGFPTDSGPAPARSAQ